MSENTQARRKRKERVGRLLFLSFKWLKVRTAKISFDCTLFAVAQHTFLFVSLIFLIIIQFKAEKVE